MQEHKFNAIDLFAGCGGLSEGLKQAGFRIVAACEIDVVAAAAYKLNHPDVVVFNQDIREVDVCKVLGLLGDEPLHLLAGCPPCQGFSTLRKLNRRSAVRDERNNLISEFYRFIKALNPMTIMLENVPGIVDYTLFKTMVRKLKKLGYNIDYKVINLSEYRVPQRRKRLVLLGSKLRKIEIVPGAKTIVTVRDALSKINNDNENDELHNIYPQHSEHIQKMISLIPKNGGSRKNLPEKFKLECHKKKNIGFTDIYGRLRWDSVSSTITGGCLNPSKGRFLHPEKDRCISAREAALLQTFPIDYKFPIDITQTEIALLIGNALPPEFSRIQAKNIFQHIEKYCG